MLSPGATGRSGADIGANMIVLETRESVNRGGAEGSKRLPESQAIDIPSSAPTLEQSPWSGSHQVCTVENARPGWHSELEQYPSSWLACSARGGGRWTLTPAVYLCVYSL